MPGVRQKPNTPKGNYQGWYFVDRSRKKRKFFTGSTDRQATFVTAWEREQAALSRHGKQPTDHLVRPMQDVVHEYLAWGASQGGKRHKPWAPEHRRKQAYYLAWWTDSLGLSALGDLDGCLGRVEHVLRGLEGQGASGKTRANYAGALQGFCSWALRRRYLVEHPLQEFVLPDTTRQTVWRDFTPAEIQRLLDHCAPHRRLLYEVTLFSGLRRNELRQLALEHLDMEHSGLRLGTFTKNRQALFHPLPRDLVERLHAHAVSGEPNRVYMSRSRDEVPRDVPLAPLLYVPVGTARDLAQDLAAAGIPLVTEHGKAVFHSLRITYINLVLDLGVNPKEAQQLARHSTVNLTMNVYGRTRSEYLSGVVERLYESVCATFVQLAGVEEPLALAVGGDAGMPKGGFEPPRPVRHHPLKMACLPFPPLRHFYAPGKLISEAKGRHSIAPAPGHCQWQANPQNPPLNSANFLQFQ